MKTNLIVKKGEKAQPSDKPESIPRPSSSSEGLLGLVRAAIANIRNPQLRFVIAVLGLYAFLLVSLRPAPDALVWASALLPFVTLLAIRPSPKTVPESTGHTERTSSSSPHEGAPREPTRRTFESTEDAKFIELVEAKADRARRLVFIGCGLNVLQRDVFRRRLLERAAKGEVSLDICLADPTVPSVEDRLMEEDAGSQRPPVGRDGLVRRISALLADWERLKRPKDIRLGVFRHYPSFAVIVIDDDYYVYPYGFRLLGNFSPVTSFSRANLDDQHMIAFLDKQIENVQKASVDPRWVLRQDAREIADKGELPALAVFAIPSPDSVLYRNGSRILGRDVRSPTGRVLTSEFAPWVGDAGAYGLHLTVADVLYFANEAEREAAIADVAYIASTFRRITLSRLSLKERFPDARGIAIVPEDATGSLEALHCELVQRVYRRAVASNYSFDPSRVCRDERRERGELMLARYHAPYILGAYQPHFTLLSDVPDEKMGEVSTKVREALGAAIGKGSSLVIDHLAIMKLSETNRHWEIERFTPFAHETAR